MVNSYPERRRGRWKECGIVCAILAIGLAVALGVVVVLKDRELAEKVVEPCPSGLDGIDLNEPENPPVFGDLTSAELSAVEVYLHQQADLNLIKPSEAVVNSSYIYFIELKVPTKAEVLEHLDNNKPQPNRFAKTVIFRGDLLNPVIEEYTVGPLPKPTSHKIIKQGGLDYVPFAYRPITFTEFAAVGQSILQGAVNTKCGKLLQESFDAGFVDCGEKCLTFYPVPVSTWNFGTATRNIWFWINHKVDYYALHPLDFKILVNLDGVDPSKFKITRVWYNQQLFNDLDQLVAAYDNGSVDKIKIPFPTNDANLFSTLNLRGDPFPKKHLRSPVQVEPDGKRYSIRGQHVEYMNWAFDYRMSTGTGPMVFDVRYKGERIAYEISLQEIAVFYSAHNPSHKFADFVDSVALIGALSKTLVSGGDCPDHAVFLPARHILEVSDKPIVYENALCIFEQATGVPLRRHHSYGPHAGTFYEGMMDDVLILRTMLTVVNYDYIFDFIFHQNGAVEVKAISTGYILPSVVSLHERKYGFQLHENIVGNLHHHMFNFKVDVDVHGTSNRFETLDLGVEEVDNSQYSSFPKAQTYNQITFNKTRRNSETQATYNFNFNTPRYLIFHNDNKKTKFGELSGYRLLLRGMSFQTLPRNKGHEPSISWARYQTAVTKYKETELRSSSLYAIWDAIGPITNFESFISDDEDIVDQDLVAWVTLGLHHIPHTEDLPITPTPGGDLRFFLLPYNYFPEDPAMASQNAVRLDLKKSSDSSKPEIDVSRYGYNEKSTCVGQKSNYDTKVEEDPNIVFTTDATFG